MESIVNISLAGSYIFPIESNACRVLQEYLETLQDRVKEGEEGKEILQSIEERIVELFSEYTQEKNARNTRYCTKGNSDHRLARRHLPRRKKYRR